jgi:hypothetical protein
MKFNRLDSDESFENEITNNYDKNINKISYPVNNIQDLLFNNFTSSKNGIAEYLESFRKRTGLNDYINQINAEIEKSEDNKKTAQVIDDNEEYKGDPESLVEIPEVKSSIDNVLASGEYNRTIDIINKLQDLVNNDPKIPEDLKGVTMDAQLIDYISSKIEQNDENIDYNSALKSKDNQNINSDQRNISYFNFESKEESERGA